MKRKGKMQHRQFHIALLILCMIAGYTRGLQAQNTLTVSNDYLTLVVEMGNGQFHLLNAAGVGILNFGAIDVGRTAFRIDPDVGNPNSNIAVFGNDGTLITPPSRINNQSVLTVFDTQVGLDEGGTAAIRIEQRLTLLRDMLKIQYTVRNNGFTSHRIGMRVVLDHDLGAVGNNQGGATYLIAGRAPLQYQTEFQNYEMPSSYRAVDDVTSPTLDTMGILSGEEATLPSRLVFIDQTNMPAYEIISNPYRALPYATAVAVYYFSDTTYYIGGTKTYTLYYGLANATSDYEPNPVVALEAPKAIALMGDDPETPETEPFHFDPETFDVRAFVYNTATVSIADTTATLILPTGLELDVGETKTKRTGAIPGLGEKSLTWRVKVNGKASGKLPIGLTTASSGAASKSITRYIDVPPLPGSFNTSGVRMVTFPFIFQDPDPAVVLKNAATNSTLQPLNLATFDPQFTNYVFYTNGGINELRAGKGYWLKTAGTATTATVIQLEGADPVPQGEDFLIPLWPGWNMIGSPSLSSVYLGRTQYFWQGQAYTWLRAVQLGLIRTSVWTWDPLQGQYIAIGQESSELAPMVGYWIKSLVSGVTMVFPFDITTGRARSLSSPSPDEQGIEPIPGSEISGIPGKMPKGAGSVGEWMLQICAHSADGRMKESLNYIGVSARSSDGFDLQDIEEPPPFGGYVSVCFPHEDWGKDAGLYTQDVRAPSARLKRWNMEVVTDQPRTDVVLTWPNVHLLPQECRLTLVDLDTHQRVCLRKSKSYTVRFFGFAQSDTQVARRRFRIEAETVASHTARGSVCVARASRL